MAKWDFGDGMSEYLKELEKMQTEATPIIKKAVWAGGRVVADAFESAIAAIPSVVISDVQRDGLQEGLGLAKMKNENGYIHTKVGFVGYNNDNRYKNPNARWRANSFVARRVVSGTSGVPAYDFVRKATNQCKAASEKAMADQFDQEIQKIMR